MISFSVLLSRPMLKEQTIGLLYQPTGFAYIPTSMVVVCKACDMLNRPYNLRPQSEMSGSHHYERVSSVVYGKQPRKVIVYYSSYYCVGRDWSLKSLRSNLATRR